MDIAFFATNPLDYVRDNYFKNEEEAFFALSTFGVNYADIMDFDLQRYPMYLFLENLSNSGIAPDCFISTLNITSLDEKIRRYNLSRSKERIDTAAKLGFTQFMLAPLDIDVYSEGEWNSLQKNMVKSYTELVEYGKKAGITVAVENHSSLQRPDSRIEDIKLILDEVPDLGYVMDIGNFFCVGQDAIKAYSILKERLVRVHGKDWIYDPFGKFVRENLPRFRGCELGIGAVKLREVIHALKGDKYNGRITVEINAPSTWEQFKRSAEFLRSEYNV